MNAREIEAALTLYYIHQVTRHSCHGKALSKEWSLDETLIRGP